jgi:ketosteroid isomerase-like protein
MEEHTMTASHTTAEQHLAAQNRDLALQVLQSVGTERSYEFMADDVVIEFPYGSSVGMPDRFVGKDDVVTYLRQMSAQLAGLKMRDIMLHSVAGHPEIVFAEYEGDVPTPGGNSYVQVYLNKLQFRDGKVIGVREFWDPKRMIDALNGTFD